MLDELFNWLTLAMSDRFGIALIAAMGWGVSSIILSPCHISSIPLVIGYVGSQGSVKVRRSFMLSLIFGIGILTTIGLIGAITASVGRMMGDVGIYGNLIVAAVFFVVGMYLMDIIRLSWASFMPQSTILRGWTGALVLGLLFGVGLGPCTFAYMAPVLGVVFNLATTNLFQAIALVVAFGVGHCGVIVGAGSAAGTVQKYLRWTDRSNGTIYLKRITGALVVVAGGYYVYTAF
jgi:cytochrome c-type biogenesis protein